MAGFVFRFQKIMDIKENEKEEAKMEYAESLSRLREQEQELAHLLNLKKQWELRWNDIEKQPVSIQLLLEIQTYLRHLNQQIQKKRNKIFRAEQEADSFQQTLIDKSKELQVWEKWKDKSFLEYQEVELQCEQKIMDELGLQQFVRGGGEKIGGNRNRT